MPDDRLRTVAAALLANLADGLTAQGIDVPEHQYTHSGLVAYDLIGEDCADQFIVAFAGFPSGGGDLSGFLPGTPMKCAVPTIAQFDVHLLRCVPTLDQDGSPPTDADLQDAADTLLVDAMTLPAVAIDKALQGELHDLKCSVAGLGQVIPIGPEGAAGGVVMTLFIDMVG